MTESLQIRRLSTDSFRNLGGVSFEPHPRLNVLHGNNGQGKTSVLEAIYALATTRSFRTDHLREALRHGATESRTHAEVSQTDFSFEQTLLLRGRTKEVRLDGKAPAKLSAYAVKTPVVVFHPGDLALVSGPPSTRRKLLDRLSLHMDPTSSDERARYQRAMDERQRLLSEPGTTSSSLDVYEDLAAMHGTRVAAAHEAAAASLAVALEAAFRDIAPSELVLRARLKAAGSTNTDEFRAELRRHRAEDQRRRSATYGPQRDDIEFNLDGSLARRNASQGQQRILTLALKLAELACVREARQTHPVLLLDDFSSELDPDRSGAVYRLLLGAPGQSFITTTRPELLLGVASVTSGGSVWRVELGRVAPG